MEYVQLGKTGTKISEITLGTMQFGWRCTEDVAFEILDRAIELGINCIDTANVYSKWAVNSYAGKTEEIIGRWFADRGNRDEIVLATKLRGNMSDDINDQGLSRRHIHSAVDGSLQRLQTDWIDLYQIHSYDPYTPMEETMHGLNVLIDDGKINYLGASNIQSWNFIEALWISDIYNYQSFETVQPPYSLVNRRVVEQHYADIADKYNIGIIPYSPLAGGFLTGKYSKDNDLPDTPRAETSQTRYFNEKNWVILDTLKNIAEERGATIVQIALAWVMAKDFITSPIIGANSVEQLEENIGAIDINLNQDEITQLDQLSSWRENMP